MAKDASGQSGLSPLPVGLPGDDSRRASGLRRQEADQAALPLGPLPNYTLSTACPQCNAPTIRRACKVRCQRCGFMWDCSEL